MQERTKYVTRISLENGWPQYIHKSNVSKARCSVFTMGLMQRSQVENMEGTTVLYLTVHELWSQFLRNITSGVIVPKIKQIFRDVSGRKIIVCWAICGSNWASFWFVQTQAVQRFIVSIEITLSEGDHRYVSCIFLLSRNSKFWFSVHPAN